MTQAEATLLTSLRANRRGNGRVAMTGKRHEDAARELAKHGLVRVLDPDSPDNTGRGFMEIEWLHQQG